MRYARKPLRYQVMVDGRGVGDSFRHRSQAEIMADELQSEAPWSVVEVVSAY